VKISIIPVGQQAVLDQQLGAGNKLVFVVIAPRTDGAAEAERKYQPKQRRNQSRQKYFLNTHPFH